MNDAVNRYGEEVELRISMDKCFVEVLVNGRQAIEDDSDSIGRQLHTNFNLCRPGSPTETVANSLIAELRPEMSSCWRRTITLHRCPWSI
jgi:hypothetical protein